MSDLDKCHTKIKQDNDSLYCGDDRWWWLEGVAILQSSENGKQDLHILTNLKDLIDLALVTFFII